MTEIVNKNKALFSTDDISAVDAISHAQIIAFAPYVFQASVLLRDKGILEYVEKKGKGGVAINEVSANIPLSHYAVRVLMEAGLGIGLLYKNEDKYMLTKAGYFFLNDKMTRVNTDFMKDVCYDGAQDLEASFADGKPRGLRHLGNWDTIYQGLSVLPQPAKDSWFAFDHYYSDNAFPHALPLVFAHKPTKIMDIGSNTGKWALACLNYDPNVKMGLVDLQVQLDVAMPNLQNEGHGDRAEAFTRNMLDPETVLPQGYDIIWMSQFLDCFSDDEIIAILKKCHVALPDHGTVFVNETFWNEQRFDAGALCLQMTSLYFTAMANGNSQMYDSDVFKGLIAQAGFVVAKQHDNIGLGHTILELKKA